MSKERLEKAKKILNHIKGYGVYDGNDDIEIFEWLIEQAERVNELETTVDFYQSALRDADRRVQELEEEVDRLKVWYGAYHRETKTISRLRDENKRYREALEFYADKENYKPFDGIFLSRYQNKIDEDCGEKARQALEGEAGD